MLGQRSDVFTYLLKAVKLCSGKPFTNDLPLDLKAKATYKWRPCEGKHQQVPLAMTNSLWRASRFESYLGEIHRTGGLYDLFAL